MNERQLATDRDEVLFAFHQACEKPTVKEIVEWTKRYPEFADDIRAHAAVRRDVAARSSIEDLHLDDTMLSRGRSRALHAVYDARQRTSTVKDNPHGSWSQILTAAGFTIPALARHIQIDRMILAELAAGRMCLPIGVRLIDALINALHVGRETLEAAVRDLIARPRLGHAKSNTQPLVLSRSYEEIILASSMSDEKKNFWLGRN